MNTAIDTTLSVKLTNVSKIYRSYSNPRQRLLEIISGGKKHYAHETRALDDVSLSLPRGARLGIIGENGSGKSTLLKVLAKVLTPTAGSVLINGRVSALLELGAGFNPELIGTENIRQFCMLHGMDNEEIEEALPQIIQFSELKDAILLPVKTYSSGMAVRLGFACAVYAKPEVLIVDEALSVGDAYFQNKCLHKIKHMLDLGTTFIYVTHATDSIRALCNEGIWMEKGKIRLVGGADIVGGAYQAEIFRRIALPNSENEINEPVQNNSLVKKSEFFSLNRQDRFKAFEERVTPLRSGSGEARVLDITLLDVTGAESDCIEFNTEVRVRIFFEINSQTPENCGITLGITDNHGRQILHFSSVTQEVFISSEELKALYYIDFVFLNCLCPGDYGIICGIGTFCKSDTNKGQNLIDKIIDYCAGGARFSVKFPNQNVNLDLWGVVHLPYSVSKNLVF